MNPVRPGHEPDPGDMAPDADPDANPHGHPPKRPAPAEEKAAELGDFA